MGSNCFVRLHWGLHASALISRINSNDLSLALWELVLVIILAVACENKYITPPRPPTLEGNADPDKTLA